MTIIFIIKKKQRNKARPGISARSARNPNEDQSLDFVTSFVGEHNRKNEKKGRFTFTYHGTTMATRTQDWTQGRNVLLGIRASIESFEADRRKKNFSNRTFESSRSARHSGGAQSRQTRTSVARIADAWEIRISLFTFHISHTYTHTQLLKLARDEERANFHDARERAKVKSFLLLRSGDARMCTSI